MKNKTGLILGILGLAFGVSLALTGSASAYKGDPSIQGPNYSLERHIAMEQAFENNDYTAWQALMDGKGRVTQVVTEENFAKFAEAHKLAKAGDLEGARKIKAELGLGLKDGSGYKNENNFGQGIHRSMRPSR